MVVSFDDSSKISEIGGSTNLSRIVKLTIPEDNGSLLRGDTCTSERGNCVALFTRRAKSEPKIRFSAVCLRKNALKIVLPSGKR